MNSTQKYLSILLLVVMIVGCTNSSTEPNNYYNNVNYEGVWNPSQISGKAYLDIIGYTYNIQIGHTDKGNVLKVRMNNALGCFIFVPEIANSMIQFSPPQYNFNIEFENFVSGELTIYNEESKKKIRLYKTNIVPDWSPCS